MRKARAASFFLAAGMFCAVPHVALADDNIYTNVASGKWDTPNNWSLGAPNTNDSIYITNAGTKTVTLDATTSSGFSNTLSVTNLTLAAPTDSVNTLLLTNLGQNTPLTVHEVFWLMSGGQLVVSNSSLNVDCARPPVLNADNGSYLVVDGPASFNSAVINASNASQTVVGSLQPGSLSITNSQFTAHELDVGYYAGASASFVNSTSHLGYGFNIADVQEGAPSIVMIIGGKFVATNTPPSPPYNPGILIGGRGMGTLTVSNADVELNDTVLGAITGSSGSLIFQGGTMTLGKTYLGVDAENDGNTARGSIVISDGLMTMPELHIGYQATGTVAVTGGFLSNSITKLAEANTASGTLNITGGTNWISSLLIVGSNNPAASVSVAGGALFVTNGSGTATTIVDGGSLLHGAGLFKTDNLILTNGGRVITVSNYVLGATAGTTNLLVLNDGSSLTITNAVLGLGNDGTTTNGSGTASATLSNATLSATVINLGSTSGGLGTLDIQSNATVVVDSNLTVVSSSLVATSSVTVSGGSLTATNGILAIGPSGSARMTLAAGTVTANQIKVGGPASGASGTLLVSTGAHLKFLSSLSANFVDVGGDIDGNGGGALYVGEGHDAAVFVSQGFIHDVGTITVGYLGGYTGTLTVDTGGVVQATTNIIVGDCASTNQAIGLVTLSGGALYITNATHTAVLDVRNGTFTLNAGSLLVVDNLFITNACAHFVNNGGAIIYNNPLRPAPVLDPNLDADGDGQSNANELRAGTDPLDPNANLRLLSARIVNSTDVRLDWTAVGGHSYVVQVSTNLVGSQLTNFRDLSPVIAVGDTNTTSTNYVHIGGATNRAAYYRVRLGP